MGKNRYRALLLAKGRRHWIYAYLFAKKDRANIDEDELDAFRRLAKNYATLTDPQIADLVRDGEFTEICHDGKA